MREFTPKEELDNKAALIERIQNADLDELIDWSLETYYSDENRRRMESKKKNKFIIYIGRTVYGKILNFTQKEFFEDSRKSVAAQLREKLFVHHILEEDTPFNLNIGVDLGTALEATLFGMDYEYPGTADPTYKEGNLLEELSDYKKLEMPDFYKSGWMPEAHRLYREIQEISQERFDVYFPGWARGPWSMATILRGFNNTFYDYMDDPEELADFLMFLADARICFEDQRCKFLGISPQDKERRWTYCSYRYNYNSDLFEDEVDGSLFSAEMNREIIIPAQKKLSEYYNGISYYHSCGSLVPLIDDIAQLNVCKYQHISPATFPGYEKFDKVLAPDVIAQISLRPLDVANLQSEEQAQGLLEPIFARLTERRAEICADALFSGGWELIEKVMLVRNAYRKLEKAQ